VAYPFAKHRFCVVTDESSGSLAAYAACREEGSTLVVADFALDETRPGVDRALWLALMRDGYKRGARSLSVECLAPARIARSLKDAGLVARNRAPVYAAFTSEKPEGDWFVTPADADV
jgi:hypothetical protein